MKLGWARSWPASNFLVHHGRDAAARKDFATAAGAYERVVLGVLATEISFLETSAYLAVPALARTYRARAALTAGHVEEALAHARASLELMPGHMDVALLLVPELDKRGRKADADALYNQAAAPYQTLAKDYPQSGHAHNAVAWLGAFCHRDLNAALDHARKATTAEPKQAGYRDTLAEVHFQRGETDVAIKLMRECIAMDSRKAYFAKQLKRFEAGDRTVPPPDEEEE
jgi:tetratricopeptide (TPR) repeat protein